MDFFLIKKPAIYAGGQFYFEYYKIRITPKSNNNVKTIHHQEQFNTFVNFSTANISVNMFYSFLTHCDYIPISNFLQLYIDQT
jgi:hypothetical protein